MDYNAQVFLEALWAASIIPFSNDATFSAMAAFGNFDMHIPAVIAIIGATMGQIFNLIIGRLFLELHKKGLLYVKAVWYDRIAGIFNKYCVFLLLFSWVSILKLLLVFAGFLGTGIRFALPLILIGQIYHYSSYLM